MSNVQLKHAKSVIQKDFMKKQDKGLLKILRELAPHMKSLKHPEIIVESHVNSIEESVEQVIQYLKENQLI